MPSVEGKRVRRSKHRLVFGRVEMMKNPMFSVEGCVKSLNRMCILWRYYDIVCPAREMSGRDLSLVVVGLLCVALCLLRFVGRLVSSDLLYVVHVEHGERSACFAFIVVVLRCDPHRTVFVS